MLQRLTTRSTPKATRQAARYTPAGGAERCGMCRHFAAPSACSRILGPVSASGWCAYFSRQVTYQDHAGQATALGGPPGASLDLSFMSAGSLPAGITFTRASTATYFDSTGTMQTAATNAPRWDYNPSTRALQGLLIEEARTNNVLNSGDASNASWGKTQIGAGVPVVTGNQTTAPDGTLTGARAVFPAVSSAGQVSALNMVSIAGTAAPWTSSIWVKGNVGGESLYLYASPDGVTYFRSQIVLTTTWQRFSLTTGNLTLAGWSWALGCDRRDASQTGISAQTIFVWGGQVEVGAFPSSYIPTTSAALTRPADVCTMPIAAWFNANTTSLQMEAYLPVFPAGSMTGFGDGAVFGNSMYFARDTGVGAVLRAGGGTARSAALSTGVVNKLACTNTATQVQCCANGGAVGSVVQSASALTATTQLAIGTAPWNVAGAASQLNGHMRRVRYWPRVLTNAELQSVTT